MAEGKRKYEERDAHFSRVMVTAFSLIGVMVLGLLCAWAAFVIFTTGDESPVRQTETFTTPDTAAFPPGPNLEADPHESLVALHAREDSVLQSYGWEDSGKGIVRVPIGRAKELYLERGGKR